MLKRYWVIVFALGLMSSVAFGQSTEGANPEQQNSERQAQTGNDSPASFGFPIRILEEPEQSEAARQQQDEASQREIEDLFAQQSMADSTEEIVFWTKLQFVLAFAGTLALLYSLHLNRKATNTAVQALGMERAWLTNVGVQIAISEGHPEDTKDPFKSGLLVSVSWKNTGRSPAIRIVLHMADLIITEPDSKPGAFTVNETEMANAPGGSAMGPGQTFGTQWKALSRTDFERLQKKEICVWVYSQVRYFTTSNRKTERRSEASGQLVFQGAALKEGRRFPHVAFVSEGEQNDST